MNPKISPIKNYNVESTNSPDIENCGRQKLTRKEIKNLELINIGLENKAIAKKLSISVKTVESHKENIKQKLGIKTIRELYESEPGRNEASNFT